MSRLSGWYPQLDGQQRYWDGELWSDSAPARKKAKIPAGLGGGRHVRPATVCAWGGLSLAVLSGALSSGFSGAAAMSGLFALVVGVVALARGRVGWARLRSRAAGVAERVRNQRVERDRQPRPADGRDGAGPRLSRATAVISSVSPGSTPTATAATPATTSCAATWSADR